MLKKLQETLEISKNIALKNINIKDVPLPSIHDLFQLIIAKNSMKIKAKTQLGRFHLLNILTNEKLFKYNSVLSDDFGKKCAFWYKNLTLANSIESLVNKECCFSFNLKKNRQKVDICMEKNDKNCKLKSLSLMKSLKKGCLAGEKGLSLSENPELIGCGNNREENIFPPF